jgi:hypothetical protein
MRIGYHKMMRSIKENIWHTWHCRLRRYFDRKFYNTSYYDGDTMMPVLIN